ncbi:MAG TPA: hypothetical protein VM305_04820 [Candidatus Limnocylindrales bacterium]|nr:hypothetical protein [Candidatus Limnocylindrales bacterium]
MREREMQSIAVRHAADLRQSRLVLLVAAVVIALLATAVGPAAAQAAPVAGAGTDGQPQNAARLKMVVIVGPTHSSTSSYLSRGETLAQTGEKYGMDVRRVFHPRATPQRVLNNIQGANIVAYLGHGNGWPSPYAPFQERTKNGIGLNAVEGGSQNDVAYHGGNWIRSNVTLAQNAVVLLNGLCYAEGNGEPSMPIPTWSVAHQRVDNYAAAFLAVGARAVFAYGWQSVNSIVDQLFTTTKTMDEIFMTRGSGSSPSSGFLGWDNRRLDSGRMPGFRNHLDPHSTSGFLRALSGTLEMTTSEWSGGQPPTEVVPPPSSPPSVPTGLIASADATGAVSLAWNASTATVAGTIRYRVFRNGSAIGSQQTARTYVDRPSKSGTYSYQVRAIDAADNKSDLSTPPVSVQVTVPTASPSPSPSASPSPSPTTAPAAAPSVPQGLAATAHDNFVVKLSWNASVSAAAGTVRYRVFRDGVAIGTKQTATTFTDQHLAAATFKYQVRAIDAAGNKSALSAAVTVSSVLVAGSSGSTNPGQNTGPTVPQALTATAETGFVVKLTWHASSSSAAGPIHYRVFRNGKAIGTKQTALTFIDQRNKVNTFTYQVRAIDSAGRRSALSPPITITTKP